MTVIDLHSHSTRSDGALSPTDLVQYAHDHDVGTLALTDHDTTAGIAEAKEKAEAVGMRIVAGVELTCHCAGREVHLLGLGVDTTNENLQDLCAQIREQRHDRFLKMMDKLRALGAPLSESDIPTGTSLARPVLARLLVNKGYVSTIKEAFSRWLKNHGPAYVEHQNVPIQTAIDAIQAAKGVAILAHPGIYPHTFDAIDGAIDAGADGIECRHSDHNADMMGQLEAMADANGWLQSGGADFHTPDHPRAKLLGKRSCRPEQFARIEEALAARA